MGNRARREAVGLLAASLGAAALILGAGALSFAPVWPSGQEQFGSMEDLSALSRVNINTASLRELCCLPGVGEARALEILSYRVRVGPFQSLSELIGIDGINAGTIVSWGNMAYIAEHDAEGS